MKSPLRQIILSAIISMYTMKYEYLYRIIKYCVVNVFVIHFPTEIQECAGNPCQNGATCVDNVGYYDCICQAGYNGTHCENGELVLDNVL